MIASALKFLVDDICHTYLVINPMSSVAKFVELDEVPKPEDYKDSIILTIVNFEEEKTLKNGTIYQKNNGGVNKRNPTIYLNLYLLFSSNQNQYPQSINRISELIETIQAKNVFTAENTMSNASFPINVEKIILDLYSLNFEQLNHLWGILGGKYQPSVMYKARLIAIQASDLGPVATIEEIATNN